MQVDILISNKSHVKYSREILDTIEDSAKARGTGIAKRSIEYIENKIANENAVIAIATGGEFAGFSYIETFQEGNFLVNSGLIVAPKYRKLGLSRKIKKKIFEYSRQLHNNAKIFGITTNLTVLKINSELGYLPVTYSELPRDKSFWDGCKTCVNYGILESKNHKMCLCTALLYNPNSRLKKFEYNKKAKFLARLKRIKQSILLKTKLKVVYNMNII